jgi:arginase
VDVDVLDEAVVPATDNLMPDGLDVDELVALVRPVVASPDLVGWSLACYNPEKDPDGASVRRLLEIIERAADAPGSPPAS